MGRDDNRRSRFGPPNTYGNSRNAFKTPEQIAFDSEFAKWEESFEQWKKSFANHPDRNAYQQYERKFLDVREKLIQKRKQIYNHRPVGPKIPFENQLSAADAMANSILSKFGEPNYGRSGSTGRRDDWRDSGGRRDDWRNRGRSGGRYDDHYRGNSYDRSRGGGGGRFDNSHDRGRNNNRMQDRFGGGNNRFGCEDRNRRSRAPKPSPAQIEKELKRTNVYPLNKWQLCPNVERPPLVGKRAKKKNTKILNFLERKRKIENGEVPLEELPFGLRIEKLFEIARDAECPARLQGSNFKKLKALKGKDSESLSPDERKFIAYADYVIAKRSKYFEMKKIQEEGNKAPEGMEGVEAANTPNENIESFEAPNKNIESVEAPNEKMECDEASNENIESVEALNQNKEGVEAPNENIEGVEAPNQNKESVEAPNQNKEGVEASNENVEKVEAANIPNEDMEVTAPEAEII